MLQENGMYKFVHPVFHINKRYDSYSATITFNVFCAALTIYAPCAKLIAVLFELITMRPVASNTFTCKPSGFRICLPLNEMADIATCCRPVVLLGTMLMLPKPPSPPPSPLLDLISIMAGLVLFTGMVILPGVLAF